MFCGCCVESFVKGLKVSWEMSSKDVGDIDLS